jgi:prolyl-tRNA synthetase
VIPIEADTGLMGGDVSHEFTLPHSEGEDRFVRCSGCGYSANVEAATFQRGEVDTAEMLAAEVVETPDCKTIAELCAFLKIHPQQTLKAVFYTMDAGLPSEGTFLVMLRGDLEVNEAKLQRVTKANTLEAATDEAIRRHIGAEPGYASPIGLPVRHSGQTSGVRIIGDESLPGMRNFVTGANRAGYHTIQANYPRDFEVTEIGDIAEAYDGAICTRCGATLRIERAIELGHCFKLGTRYSVPVGVTYVDVNGQAQHVVMGSYGIGLDRLLAAIIETHHDEQGILWPLSVSPFQVHIVGMAKNEAAAQAAEEVYRGLQTVGIETLYDDRNLSPGVMFADADLIGIPLRVTVSPRSLDAGGVEVKWRWEEQRAIVPLDTAVGEIEHLLQGSGEPAKKSV